MADPAVLSPPLGVVHRRQLRPIVEHIEQGSPGAWFIATCASPALRGAAERWLERQLGPGRLISLDASSGRSHAWSNLVAYQEGHGGVREGCVYSMWGFAALAAARPGAPHPYVGLNLNRDTIGASGTNLLIWLDSLEELNRFVDLAPDYWSRRTHVATLLSEADFEGPDVAPDPDEEDLEAKFRRLEKEAAAVASWPEMQSRVLRDQAQVRIEQGRGRDALVLLDRAEALLAGRRVAPHTDEIHAIGVRRIEALDRLGRTLEARRLAEGLIADGPSATRELARGLLAGTLQSLDCHLAAARTLTTVLERSPVWLAPGDRARELYHRALNWFFLGRLRSALSDLAGARSLLAGGGGSAFERRVGRGAQALEAEVQIVRGELVEGLAALHAAASGLRSAGFAAQVQACTETAAGAYREMGLVAEAARLSEDYLRGTLARGPRKVCKARRMIAELEWLLPFATPDQVHSELALGLDEVRVALLGESDPDERYFLRWHEAVTRWKFIAPTFDDDSRAHHYEEALRVLDEAERELHTSGPEERLAECVWERAEVLRVAKRHSPAAEAFAEAARRFAEQERVEPQAQVLTEAAENELDRDEPAAALRLLAEALPIAVGSDSVYRIVHAQRVSRRAHAQLGATADADAAFEAALSLLRAEGLVPEEIDLLLDRAEDRNVAAATRRADADHALDLAVQIGHVYRESRALVVAARLALEDRKPEWARRLLAGARELVEELGPRDRLREVEELEAAAGTATTRAATTPAGRPTRG